MRHDTRKSDRARSPFAAWSGAILVATLLAQGCVVRMDHAIGERDGIVVRDGLLAWNARASLIRGSSVHRFDDDDRDDPHAIGVRSGQPVRLAGSTADPAALLFDRFPTPDGRRKPGAGR